RRRISECAVTTSGIGPPFPRSVNQPSRVSRKNAAWTPVAGSAPLRLVYSGQPKHFPTTVPAMSEVTRILSAIEQGQPHAAEELLPLVYDELRKLAAQRLAEEKPGQTLQATALVHEAYLRLVGAQDAQRWDSRGHFFAAAAEAMRRILLNRARDKKRAKRGGERRRVDLDQ